MAQCGISVEMAQAPHPSMGYAVPAHLPVTANPLMPGNGALDPSKYDPRTDPEFHANKCCGCPPTLKGCAVGQIVVDSICIIVGIITLFVIGALGLLQILAGILGLSMASMVLCSCKCCAPVGELCAYVSVLSIQVCLSIVDVIVYASIDGGWFVVVGAVIIGLFRVICIVVGATTICKTQKAMKEHVGTTISTTVSTTISTSQGIALV